MKKDNKKFRNRFYKRALKIVQRQIRQAIKNSGGHERTFKIYNHDVFICNLYKSWNAIDIRDGSDNARYGIKENVSEYLPELWLFRSKAKSLLPFKDNYQRELILQICIQLTK